MQQFVSYLGSIDLRGWNPQAFPKTPEGALPREPRTEPEEVSQKKNLGAEKTHAVGVNKRFELSIINEPLRKN